MLCDVMCVCVWDEGENEYKVFSSKGLWCEWSGVYMHEYEIKKPEREMRMTLVMIFRMICVLGQGKEKFQFFTQNLKIIHYELVVGGCSRERELYKGTMMKGYKWEKIACMGGINAENGKIYCFYFFFFFCCLIRMNLINFSDVPLASLLVVEIVVVEHWIHFSAAMKKKIFSFNMQEFYEMKAITCSDPCSTSGAGVAGTSHSSVGGTTQRNECLSNTSCAGHLWTIKKNLFLFIKVRRWDVIHTSWIASLTVPIAVARFP